jgi:polyphosphate:AMP phosphotransferase
MFEAAELGRKVSKATYNKKDPELRTALLDVQFKLRELPFQVIIIVSGVEGAGKGEVVNELNRWLDSRGMQTHAFWDESDEERERPRFWRFWRRLPPKSTIGVLFGSWYTAPIIDMALGRTSQAEFESEMDRIGEFERLLSNDGALIIKFWFHLSKKVQQKRLKQDEKNGKGSPLLKEFAKSYNRFKTVSEMAIRATDSGYSPWHIVEAEDRRYRNLAFGETLLNAIERRLEGATTAGPDPRVREENSFIAEIPEASITVLDHVDLTQKLTRKEYRERLEAAQRRLRGLAWQARKAIINTVAVFEGWDAAGKGGAIRRVTGAIDARLYRVISVAAPTDEENAQHYLWRFWRQLPRAGYFTIYDRSWYGRVLVERVENFCTHQEWSRAYQEINHFEQQLAANNTVVLKFWLHISQEEQLARFKEREKIAWKQYKLTEEDWRNRDRWDAYKHAVNDMVARTSTTYAPWTLVPGNDKWLSRVTIVETFCEQLAAALHERGMDTPKID